MSKIIPILGKRSLSADARAVQVTEPQWRAARTLARLPIEVAEELLATARARLVNVDAHGSPCTKRDYNLAYAACHPQAPIPAPMPVAKPTKKPVTLQPIPKHETLGPAFLPADDEKPEGNDYW